MSDCAPVQQSWTRPRNDPFHAIDDQRITSYALRYYITPPEANCPDVYPVDPTTRLQAQGNSWPVAQWRTDVETDLKGINRFGNRVRDEGRLYNPDTNKFNRTPLQHAKDESFPLDFNRLNNPPCTLRATGWNRWQPLFHNPQETFEQPFDFFIPSRTIDKERYKIPIRTPPPTAIAGTPPYNPLQDQRKFGPAAEPGSKPAPVSF